MSLTMGYIKEGIMTNIKKANYYSDGCADQYKNCKNFINICMHHRDFFVDCTWTFSATSYRKCTCDGIGGTLKWLTARASLQRPFSNQILTAKQVLSFVKKKYVTSMCFLFARERFLKEPTS